MMVAIKPEEDVLYKMLKTAFPKRGFNIMRDYAPADFKGIILNYDAYMTDDEVERLETLMEEYCGGVLNYTLERMVF